MNDPISAEEYFRGTLKVIAHWSEVDLSAEWETGLRGVIRSITDAAREVLSAHPTSQHSSSPGAAFAEPTTVAANAYDGSDARPNSGLDSRDRGHNEVLIRQLREIATEFAIDNKTDCKQHVCWIVADRLQRSSERIADAEKVLTDPAAFHLHALRNNVLSRMNALHIAGATDYDVVKARLIEIEDRRDHTEGGLQLLLAAAKAGDPMKEIIFRIEEELRQLRRPSTASVSSPVTEKTDG